jgi:hypothetical protein
MIAENFIAALLQPWGRVVQDEAVVRLAPDAMCIAI